MISIGAVLPFLSALMSPDTLFESDYLKPLTTALEIDNSDQLLLPLTLIFISAAMIAGFMRLTLLWAQARLGNAIGADLSIQIYENTLYQPYSVHASRNSSEVIAAISNKVNDVVGNNLLPLLSVISSVFLLAGIFAALVVIDVIAALAAFSVFGAVYALVLIFSKKQLARNGERISKEYIGVVKALQEGLGGIRDVLIDGTQTTYCEIYRSADLPLRKAKASIQIISASPRFIIEALGIVLIATLAYQLNDREGGVAAAVPVLGALAIGAQRFLPVLQQLYSGWTGLRGGQASLNDVLDLIEQPLPHYANNTIGEPISFNKTIKFNDVSFRYSELAPWVLRDINIEIPKGARVGFMGTTGSGKSTLLDIFMALLPPERGSLLVDEIQITNKNLRSWQSHIAHVPQSIYLADTTIAENIAFGVTLNKIDHDLVKESALKAQIAEIIESWEQGYQTQIGERGVRLSGGQRQRIGIARALYKQANVIIFDEATSALDNVTEEAVMGSLEHLGSEVTLLIVAHRLTTLRFCDFIVELSNGNVRSIGTYEQVRQRVP